MFTFTVIILIIIFIALLLVASVQPQSSEFTVAELERRSRRSAAFKRQLEREKLLPDLLVLLRIVTALFFVLTITLSFSAFGWLFGCIVAVAVAIFYPVLARGKVIHRHAQNLYSKYELHLLGFVQKFQAVFHFLRDTSLYDEKTLPKLASKEELIEIIEASNDILTPNQQKLVTAGLEFSDKRVESIMQPKKAVKFINKDEFLGPLVLDELYANGHSRLPVIDGDLDHIVGILHLRDLLSLDVKRSTSAGEAMEPKVYYIRHDDSLELALATFVKVRHHLLIVVNEAQETVGLITLDDVVESLIGYKISSQDSQKA